MSVGPMAGRTLNDQRMKVVYAVSFYWTVSILLVFLNKESMNRLDAPIFITWTQVVTAVIGCAILSHMRRSTPMLSFFPEFEFRMNVALQVLPLTLTFIAMVTFNNLCLQYVNVSFYQVARSLTIVFNVIFTWYLMGQKTSPKALAAVATVVAGYVIGSWSELSLETLSFRGSIYGVLASVFVSLYAINVKKALAAVNDDKWLLMIYNNMLAMFLMPPLIFVFNETTAILENPVVYTTSFWTTFIFFTGVFGFLINIATYAQIQATSPLTHNISGTAKSAFQSVMALVLLSETISKAGAFGLFLVIGGSFAYGWVRDSEMKTSAPPAADFKKILDEDDFEMDDLPSEPA
ncbi:unnamed protein product (mitochondrion) [Plasmodiophora brassicae]|uniref:Sugar phosphate transporter domain-containing protein n=1 Tax=Plasmodiophora brassicae TaxID=37360 RepID=A0A0G4IME5_PLABS|nr:hypothetical protein PBRA_005087 [Plasmodiophora brassicae]SPQ99355.1 unnamed protein product [Plasmodiophora brassicae]